jgi:hypothetical protein
MQWIDDQQPMFALAYWGPDDIHSLRDESGLAPWSDGEAEDWLADNEKKIRERMIEAGWDYISAYMS